MHYYLRFALMIASISGVFPVQNIYRKSTKSLSFRWLSVLTIYSVLLLTGFLTIEIYSLDYTVRNLNEDNLSAKGKKPRTKYSDCWLHFNLPIADASTDKYSFYHLGILASSCFFHCMFSFYPMSEAFNLISFQEESKRRRQVAFSMAMLA